ncbi:hypothetical protein QTP88_000823 [Uroleucon formosanum]
MLKFTSVKLELLNDFEKVLFLESGMRGGLVQASKRYAKANNFKTPGYRNDEPDTWLVYLDANNLYGYAMGKYMPISDFTWYPGNPEVALAQLEWMTETDDFGRIYEVDLFYPQTLHDSQNDMPFLPHASIPHGSTVRKLMVTFERKERYVVHYLNLKQAMAHGVVVEKVHRVLEFRQSPWLAPYIALNTEMRKRATNKFEEQFFKDLNNSVFDSLFYQVATKDFYGDLIDNPNLMLCTDTSNLPTDHKGYAGARKRIPGLFKDEAAGKTIYEFVALRAKSYAYDMEQESPQLFPETFNPAHYTLHVPEYVDPRDTLGFNAGQPFPWTSPTTSTPLHDGQGLEQYSWESTLFDSPTVLNLISGRFPSDDDVIQQSGYTNDTGWSDLLHWKKKMLLKFNATM